MASAQFEIYIVDDDAAIRRSMALMLDAAGIRNRAFSSGDEFLAETDSLPPGTVLLDIRMPGTDGLEVLETLRRRDIIWPVIVMTGHGDVPMAVRAIRLGAIDFLEKPFREEDLEAALGAAARLLQDHSTDAARRVRAREQIARLTPRETEVLRGLLAGMANKVIAHRFGISLRTAEMHRANLMTKLEVKSLADVMRLAGQADVAPLDAD